MANQTAAGYGKRYWCIKTDLSPDGEIYVHADEVRFAYGAAIFESGKDVRLALAAGSWKAVFAASVIDGHAVAVEHWKDEILDR